MAWSVGPFSTPSSVVSLLPPHSLGGCDHFSFCDVSHSVSMCFVSVSLCISFFFLPSPLLSPSWIGILCDDHMPLCTEPLVFTVVVLLICRLKLYMHSICHVWNAVLRKRCDREIRRLIKWHKLFVFDVVLLFLIFCNYWYMRNFLLCHNKIYILMYSFLCWNWLVILEHPVSIYTFLHKKAISAFASQRTCPGLEIKGKVERPYLQSMLSLGILKKDNVF